ncbi:MAG: SUMF1/EgtB/PvdO family nonheme iron enzyme [Isosphaeraceae bacterium]|nr:SUMF1/EgtB/PvdO family nonheme iron enzyme [Isosphaeraceae bacterium]
MAVVDQGVMNGESVPRLIEQLQSGEASLRWKAARSLGRLGAAAEPAVPVLAEALRDRSVLLRVAAAEALNMMAPTSRAAVPALVRALKDHYASVREVAAEALGKLGAEASEVVAPLREALGDESPYVRSQAADALVRIGPDVVPILADGLADADASIRAAMATVLGRMGGATGVTLPALRTLAQDSEASVRAAAGEAIRNLLGGRSAAPGLPAAGEPAGDVNSPQAQGPVEQESAGRAAGELASVPASGRRDDEPAEADWRLPEVLHLGRLRPGGAYEFSLRFDLPGDARLAPDLAGLSVEPELVAPGPNEVVLRFVAPAQEGPVRGRLRLSTVAVRRSIVVRGQVTPGANEPSRTRAVIWEPLDWAERRAAASAPESAKAGGSGPAQRDSRWAIEELSAGSRPVPLVPEVLVVRPNLSVEAGRPAEPAGGALQRFEPLRKAAKARGGRRTRSRSGMRWVVALLLLMIAPVAFTFRVWRGLAIAPRTAGPAVRRAAADARTPVAAPPQKKETMPRPARETAATVVSSPKQPGPVVNSLGMRLTFIPTGRFMMGSPDSDEPNDRPPHEVRITRPFYLAIHEVTQAEWRALMNERPNPSWFARNADGSGRDKVAGLDTGRHPVEIVSWADAVLFCNRLSVKEGLVPYYRIEGDKVAVPEPGGKGYRLPTEAEWEYAVRDGARGNWFFGASPTMLGRYAWFSENSDERTHPVGEKSPNDFGLFDVYGNVAEWCWDWDGPYGAEPQSDPTGPPDGLYRVIRGGGWNAYRADIGSARRFALQPDERHKDTGFRVARTALEPRS